MKQRVTGYPREVLACLATGSCFGGSCHGGGLSNPGSTVSAARGTGTDRPCALGTGTHSPRRGTDSARRGPLSSRVPRPAAPNSEITKPRDRKVAGVVFRRVSEQQAQNHVVRVAASRDAATCQFLEVHPPGAVTTARAGALLRDVGDQRLGREDIARSTPRSGGRSVSPCGRPRSLLEHVAVLVGRAS